MTAAKMETTAARRTPHLVSAFETRAFGAEGVRIGDLNGDLVPDVAVANYHTDDISVLLGLGDGTLAEATHHAAGDTPLSVAIGDMNNDDIPDLAAAIS